MSELVEKEAQGMEVYFVLSGAGVFRTVSTVRQNAGD